MRDKPFILVRYATMREFAVRTFRIGWQFLFVLVMLYVASQSSTTCFVFGLHNLTQLVAAWASSFIQLPAIQKSEILLLVWQQ